MQNLKIYVCCHKDYKDVGITNPCYRLISDKDIKNESSLELVKSDGFLDNRLWSELSHIYYVWKHPELQDDWIGFCHYRRYFDFKNDIPEITKPIVATALINPLNNFMSYFVNHNALDLMQTLVVLKKLHPEYAEAMVRMCDSHRYYPYNMFILPKAMFNEMCELLFSVLITYDKKLKVNNNYENMLMHIGDYRELYIEKPVKDDMPNDTYQYQARLYGFLSERLMSAYIMKYRHDNGMESVVENDVTITEATYNRIIQSGEEKKDSKESK